MVLEERDEGETFDTAAILDPRQSDNERDREKENDMVNHREKESEC